MESNYQWIDGCTRMGITERPTNGSTS